MNINELTVGDLSTNCYLVSDEDALMIVDPGGEYDEIIKNIQEIGKKPKCCFLTHAHFDHILALGEIIKKYEITVFVNDQDLFLLKQSVDYKTIEKHLKFVKGGSEIMVGKEKFIVLETPGHTPGSTSLYCVKKETLFVGDLIFDGGFVGRTDFEYGDESVLYESISDIVKLPSSTVVYPGHGFTFLLSDWKR